MNTNVLILAILLIGVGYYIGSDMGLFDDPNVAIFDQHRDLMDRFNRSK